MNKFKELLEKAGDLQFIKKAKDYIAIHKIAAVTTATTAAAGENITDQPILITSCTPYNISASVLSSSLVSHTI